ncbi:hypothetical protein D3C78_1512730 [compost metagenome]
MFAGDTPTFLYWLTLNSHLPYDARDIQGDNRCVGLPSDAPASVCRHHLLGREFFDALTQLLLRPEMHGAEVVVVGDHAPPFAEIKARQLYDSGRVGFLHLRVTTE